MPPINSRLWLARQPAQRASQRDYPRDENDRERERQNPAEGVCRQVSELKSKGREFLRLATTLARQLRLFGEPHPQRGDTHCGMRRPRLHEAAKWPRSRREPASTKLAFRLARRRGSCATPLCVGFTVDLIAGASQTGNAVAL